LDPPPEASTTRREGEESDRMARNSTRAARRQ
jgi:hypothetical protein